MQHSFRYGEETIRYQVRFRALRKSGRIAIHVEPDGRVVVDAPDDSSEDKVKMAVRARARWIHSHVEAIRHRKAGVFPREYVSGESILYFGRRYRLKVVVEASAMGSVHLRGAFVEVGVPHQRKSLIRAALLGWYRARAKLVLAERLKEVASGLHWTKVLPPTRFQVMKTQWGSCSPAGTLTLNPYLIRAPRECIDYVLLHELCHLKQHNHSPRFFRLLDAHMPEWRKIKTRLDTLAELILNV